MESKSKTTKKKTTRKKASKKKTATKKENDCKSVYEVEAEIKADTPVDLNEPPEFKEPGEFKAFLAEKDKGLEMLEQFIEKNGGWDRDKEIIELNTGTDIMHPVLNRKRLRVGANSVKKIVRADDSTFIVTVDNEHDRNNIVRHEIIIPITNVAWWQYEEPDIPK